MVEEEKIRQTKHKAGNRQRQQRQELEDACQQLRLRCALHQPGVEEDQERPDHHGAQGHLQTVDIGAPTTSVHATELIVRSEEHTSELQSRPHLVCRLLLEKKK